MGSFRLRCRRQRWWETSGPAPSQPFSRQEFSKVNRGKRAGCRRSNENAIGDRDLLSAPHPQEFERSHSFLLGTFARPSVSRRPPRVEQMLLRSNVVARHKRERAMAKESETAISRSMHPINNCSSLSCLPSRYLPSLPSPSLSVSLPSFFPLLSFSVGNTTQAGSISRIWQNH